MSRIEKIDLGDLIGQYGLAGFVETGLKRGEGLGYAMSFPFEKLISIEIHGIYIRMNQAKTKDPRVILLEGSSAKMLPTAVDLVEGLSVLWWLDAHLPTKYAQRPIGNTPIDLTFPLETELKSLLELRDCSGDVFLLDDMHFFRNEELKREYGDPGDGSFIADLLESTHDLHTKSNLLTAKPRVEE